MTRTRFGRVWVVAVVTILMVPIGASAASASARSARRAAATVPPAGISPTCAPGSTQFTFANTSGRADAAVFLAIETPSNSVVSQMNFINLSVPLRDPVTSQPNFYVSSGDASGHSFYFCLNSSATGRLFISLDQAIPDLPAPLVTDPFRWGLVELGPPGSADVDYSNVNNFDFSLNLRTYATPGTGSAVETATFSGNTCQVVNAMRSAVTQVNGAAGWNAVSVRNGSEFIRVVSPDNGATFIAAWPDMTPYISAVAGGGPIVVQGKYVGSGLDPGNVGWYDFTGTFSANNLTLSGTVAGATAPNPSGTAGLTMTVPLTALASGIYDQAINGTNYTVAGSPNPAGSNDLYAKIYNDLTSAFAYGYWGSAYGSGRDTQSFWNPWSPPALPANGQPAFPAKSPTYGATPYNLFAKVMAQFSASYSMPFSENFGDGGKGSSPLLTPPLNGEVRMTLPADGWAGASGSTTCAGPGGSTHGLMLDAFGGLHGFGGAAVNTSSAAYWPNWNIARGMAEIPGGTGGYTLDAFGGVHPWGAAPGVSASAYWPGWDIARGLALNPCDPSGHSGYVLDGLGGVHPFGGAPAVRTSAYWTADLAHGLAMNPCSGSKVTGYVLDNWGGIHGFSSGAAIPAPAGSAYWPGWNIARGIAVSTRGRGYVLDGFGGVHPFGGAPARSTSAFWPGWDIARGLTFDASLGGGYVLDGYGGTHRFGAAPDATPNAYWPGWDIAKGVAT